jgi:hypothetical protein
VSSRLFPRDSKLTAEEREGLLDDMVGAFAAYLRERAEHHERTRTDPENGIWSYVLEHEADLLDPETTRPADR